LLKKRAKKRGRSRQKGVTGACKEKKKGGKRISKKKSIKKNESSRWNNARDYLMEGEEGGGERARELRRLLTLGEKEGKRPQPRGAKEDHKTWWEKGDNLGGKNHQKGEKEKKGKWEDYPGMGGGGTNGKAVKGPAGGKTVL